MRPALALLALAVPAACFVAPQRRLAARPLFAEEKADFDPNAKVSQLDEVLIQWGIKDDPRIPEECRVDPMTRIKEAGKAGVAAYTLTEFAFWLGSVPLAIALVAYTTGSLPDFATTEGKEAVAGYVFVFINFARVIVPLRIALALALVVLVALAAVFRQLRYWLRRLEQALLDRRTHLVSSSSSSDRTWIAPSDMRTSTRK